MGDLRRKIMDSKKEIKMSRINNPNELFNKAQDNNKRMFLFNSNLILKYVLIFLMIITITVSSVAIYKCNNNGVIIKVPGNNHTDTGNENTEYYSGVLNVTSISDLKNIISNSNNFIYFDDENLDFGKSDGGFPVDSSMGIVGSSPTYTGSVSSITGNINIDRVYSTNIQEELVDESDIVKVKGDYIYYIPYIPSFYKKDDSGKYQLVKETENCIYILKASGNDIKIVNRVILKYDESLVAENEDVQVFDVKTSTPKDMYVTDDYLVVRVSTSIKSLIKISESKSSSYTNYRYFTEFLIFDISSYELVNNISVPGSYTSSRLIDNELYAISKYSEYNTRCLPIYFVNGVAMEASFSNIYYCPSFGLNINSYVNIFKITLNKKNIEIDNIYFMSPYIHNLYMTENAIYLIKNYSSSKESTEDTFSSWTSSKVLVIDIKNEMQFDGMIIVKGNINDKYWIDEYNGFLRVVSTGTTTTYDVVGGVYKYNRKSIVFNYMTIFEKDEDGVWKEVSSIKEGLGEEGETIKSARFNDSFATVVTFKETDPLYYIDLNDHYNPKITSALKISGFSVYQHPYKDDYVIGIGYETTSSGSRSGYKIALFDISDKENVKQVGQPIVYDNDLYYGPSVLSNPKSLFLDLENDIFGFDIVGRKIRVNTEYDSYYSLTYFYNIYKIDLNNNTNPIQTIYTASRTEDVSSTTNVLQRMVFIGNKYYLLSYDKVYIYELSESGLNEINIKNLY